MINRKVEIYNIRNPFGMGNCGYAYMNYKFAKKFGFNFNDYKKVFESNIHLSEKDELALEQIFRCFTRVTEEDVIRLEKMDFRSHSLSVSDIVKLDNKYYYRDSLSWVEIKIGE